MTDVLTHPAAGLPSAYDADGQGWLPPLWIWPTPPWPGYWEYIHLPEYLVAIGRATSVAEAAVMISLWIADDPRLPAALAAVYRGE